MATITSAEQLGQRTIDLNIVDESQLQSVWSELGTRNVSLTDFQQELLRRNLLTNYQLDRLQRGLRTGFFYGDYKVLYNVGSGTFARVFRASHQITGELFAIKVLRNRFSNPKAHPQNPETIEFFHREGELGSTLVHPNIVRIHEVVSKAVTHYLVMDFIEGRNLREFHRARRQFDPIEAASIVEGIVSGLSFAFQKGITHRDLKMSNVIVSSEGEPKLVDFGLAGWDSNLSEERVVTQRTIDYAGLERATGVRRDDTRSDIFFSGCILYQLLTGFPPLSETNDRVQRLSKSRYQDIKPIRDLMPDIPPALAMILNKAIDFDPQRRYQTPGDMLIDLKLALKRTKRESDLEAGESKTPAADQEGIGEDGQPRRIMVVESDGKMQDVFRRLFKKNGYRVLVSSDPNRALERFFDNPNAADVMLFSSAVIGQSAVEAFNRFGQEIVTRDVPAVLLLGQQHHGWESEAQLGERRAVAKMPIKPRQLREVVRNVTPRQVKP
jgi:serine/threonine-protein kinase